MRHGKTRLVRAFLVLAAAAVAAAGCGRAEARPPETALPDTAAAEAAQCEPPPAVDTVRYFNTRGGQPWALVDRFLRQEKVQFDVDSTDASPVQLCDDCDTVTVEIQSEARTECLTSAQVKGQLRILGQLEAWRFANQPEVGFGPDNPSWRILLLARDDSAFAMYRDIQGNTRFSPKWHFHFCEDGGHGHTRPSAKWKPRPAPGAAARGKPGEGETGSGQLSYGWMACANGCCQFYGPPPQQVLRDPSPDRGADYWVRFGLDCASSLQALARGGARGMAVRKDP